MSLASAVVLLQTALSLLTLVNANPSLPQSMRDNAQQVAQQAIAQATAAIEASQANPNSSAQSAPFAKAANPLPVASNDLKPQTYTIMNTAIDNYRKLISFGQECINLAKSRQITMQNLSFDRDSWLAKLSFDPLLLKQQTLLYDLYANDESAMIDYQGKCQNVIDVLNNAIDQINTDVMSLQKSNQLVSGDVLASYQERYLSNNGFEIPRAATQNVIDRINSK
jgi:hypothetical protein